MHKFISQRQLFTRNMKRLFLQKCFSKLHHDFCMFFFANKKWENKFKKLIHNMSISNPFVLKSPYFVMLRSIFLNKNSTKFFMYPIHKLFVGINNLKSWKKAKMISNFSTLNIDRSFSINYSSKTCNFSFSPHNSSFCEVL